MMDLFEHAAQVQKREEAIRNEDKARDTAIAQVEDNNEDPIGRAVEDAKLNLRSLPAEVSADTILPDLTVYGFTDGRAMGPIMKRLAKDGCIKATGEYRKSLRPGSHRMPKAVYRNLI